MPIGHITNGVHVPTWLAPQMRQLYDRHLGPEWAQRSGEPDVWERIDSVDDGELWETHQVLKSRLIAFVRRRAALQAERRGEPKAVVDALPARPEPRRPDHRLRPAVRHLQAGQPGLPRPRADRRR